MSEEESWPRYCCAILRDAEGRYLLERRPDDEVDAPGKLVCFGGGREAGEHPDACIRRELVEELGYAAGDLERCVRLVGEGGREIAWFYRGPAPDEAEIVNERGVEPVWAAWDGLGALPIGAWHRAAMGAERRGEMVAIVAE